MKDVEQLQLIVLVTKWSSGVIEWINENGSYHLSIFHSANLAPHFFTDTLLVSASIEEGKTILTYQTLVVALKYCLKVPFLLLHSHILQRKMNDEHLAKTIYRKRTMPSYTSYCPHQNMKGTSLCWGWVKGIKKELHAAYLKHASPPLLTCARCLVLAIQTAGVELRFLSGICVWHPETRYL